MSGCLSFFMEARGRPAGKQAQTGKRSQKMSTHYHKYHDLIIQALAGEISSTDRSRLQHWLALSDENRRMYEQYKAVWSLSPHRSLVPQSDSSGALAKVLGRIEAHQQNQSKTGRPLSSSRGNRLIARIWLSGVAAAILILLATSLLFFLRDPEPVHLQALAGKETEFIRLEDGSQVHLKAGASLSYPQAFGKKERSLELSGNAFFEVASDESRPFIITTSEAEIQVLATSFYVEQDLPDHLLAVSVTSGRVMVYSPDGGFDEAILEEGQRGMLMETKREIEVSGLEDMNFLAWKTSRLVFDDESLENVFRLLEQNYDISVEAPDDVMELRLTARFVDEDFRDIMQSISLVFGLELTEEDKQFTVARP